MLSSIFFSDLKLSCLLFYSQMSALTLTVLSYGVLQVPSLFYSQPVEISFICTEEFQFSTSKNVCFNGITEKSYQWICEKYIHLFFCFFFFKQKSVSLSGTPN